MSGLCRPVGCMILLLLLQRLGFKERVVFIYAQQIYKHWFPQNPIDVPTGQAVSHAYV